MLTIFSTLKPFENHIGVIQRNAIKSWTKLKGNPEIILLGNEFGVSEICKEFNLKHIPNIKCNEYGTPFCQDVFKKAQEISKHNVNAYVNGDIMLTDSFIDGIKCSSKFNHFLIIGQRCDLDVDQIIEFEDNWISALGKGVLHGVTGIDYFVFKRLDWICIPSLVLGRVAWDNWFVYTAIKRGHVVIDATNTILAIHQNHKYKIDGDIVIQKGPEAISNRKVADKTSKVHQGFISNAMLKTTAKGELIKCQL